MQKYLRLLAILGVVAMLAAACGGDGDNGENGTAEPSAEGECPEGDTCVEVAEGDPIKIGTLLSISGDTASLGLDSQAGAELAADYLDGAFDDTFGQIAGHDIEFVHEDDGCSPEGGTTGGRRLASDPQVTAVIGTTCSGSALGVADQILGDEQIVLISPSNTSPALTDPATHNEFYARTAHNDSIQGATMAQFAAEELDVQTAATIHDGSPYADGLQQVFCDSLANEFGGECTAQEAIQVGDTDFQPTLTDIAADAPDMPVFPIFLPEGGLIAQQAADISGLADTALAGADGIWTPDFVDSAGDAAEGVYLSAPSLEFSGDFYEAEFKPAYTERTGEEEPTAAFHAHSYDAFNIVAQAIDEVAIEGPDGSTLIPKVELRDAIFATEGYEGITGTLSCNENGDCQQTATMAVHQVEGGSVENPIFESTRGLEG
jgi:branched-chain amino acid transport system substrate-binding protein